MLGFLKRKCRAIQKIIEYYFFPRWQNLYWKWRHIYDPNWADNYLRTVYHPHRNQIIKAILKFQPVNSIAEIGCASGPNIIRLVKAFPNKRIIGVDISHRAIKLAKSFFYKNKYKNVEFYVSKADDLSILKDKSIDLL
jgi:ubiquinone/menaquinone biosynthesis C-methylase UbiE